MKMPISFFFFANALDRRKKIWTDEHERADRENSYKIQLSTMRPSTATQSIYGYTSSVGCFTTMNRHISFLLLKSTPIRFSVLLSHSRFEHYFFCWKSDELATAMRTTIEIIRIDKHSEQKILSESSAMLVQVHTRSSMNSFCFYLATNQLFGRWIVYWTRLALKRS